MRKMISIFLSTILLLLFSGCDQQEESLLFYYPRSEVVFGISDGVIASESREAPGHQDDLSYLLKLYLEGPISQGLTSPFPKGTTLVEVQEQEDDLVIVLSDSFTQLEGIDYTVACASIASTCFSLTDAQTVVIRSGPQGSVTMTLSRDSMTLVDHSAASEPT